MRFFESPKALEQALQHEQPQLASGSDVKADTEPNVVLQEAISPPPTKKWTLSRSGGGDTAMALFSGPDEAQEPYDKAEGKKLARKIDRIILPYLAVCYAFFYIDKTTLSYAAIFGIREDLHLVGNDYNWLSSAFYFGFLVWAIPTSFFMQRLPVGKYLGFNIFLWGVLLIAQAGTKNFATLMVLRALSGAAEACSDPSFMLITSMWYTRRQQPVRIGLWYTANGFVPKYEFIIVGCLCSLWGIILFIFLPNSPVTASMLNPRERRIAVERLLIEAFKDPKTWFFFMLGMIHNTPNGSISNFGTIIIKGFGFSTLVTTLMQVPYGVLIAFFILSCVYLNDYFATKLKKNTRCWFIILYTLPNIAGAFRLRYVPTQHHVARSWCYHLKGPHNAAFALALSLAIGNTAGHAKKVVTNAFLFLGYCTGNIAGPFFFKTNQQPTHPLGMWSMIFCHLSEIALVLAFRLMLSSENKRRDRLMGERDLVDIDATAFGDMTDWENPNFRYFY
ncbi:allantoate permease [Clohesyomyces aquaticus]|uniref:Allantoate permease n=1 Tax=Clohesyomyces aquaticus TaxID=1231657 RepID=A0A1Y2A1M6_9PLEO|nr:allantoate permease [Clohesyomyces aquaticus]